MSTHPRMPGSASTWSAKEIERLRQLAAEGLRAEDIARALKRSRNAVIGCARRRKITLLYRQYDDLPPWPGSEATQRAPKAPAFDSFSIFDLRDTTCHWPYGFRPPYLFCGRPVVQGAYCDEHAEHAYRGP